MKIVRWCACLIVFVPGFALGQIATMPAASDFVVGEQWSWHRVDNLTQLEKSRFWRRSIEQDHDLVFLGSSKRVYTVEQVYAWNHWREWPLQIGRTWQYRIDWQSPTGEPGTTTQNVEGTAYEDVVVPAGTFKAFRIEYRGTWTMRDFAGRNWGGPVSDIYWYAPEVKADVKQVHSVHSRDGAEIWTNELTKYDPAAK